MSTIINNALTQLEQTVIFSPWGRTLSSVPVAPATATTSFEDWNSSDSASNSDSTPGSPRVINTSSFVDTPPSPVFSAAWAPELDPIVVPGKGIIASLVGVARDSGARLIAKLTRQLRESYAQMAQFTLEKEQAVKEMRSLNEQREANGLKLNALRAQIAELKAQADKLQTTNDQLREDSSALQLTMVDDHDYFKQTMIALKDDSRVRVARDVGEAVGAGAMLNEQLREQLKLVKERKAWMEAGKQERRVVEGYY